MSLLLGPSCVSWLGIWATATFGGIVFEGDCLSRGLRGCLLWAQPWAGWRSGSGHSALTADCGEAGAQSPGAGARGRSLAVRRQWCSPRLAQPRPRILSPQLSWARAPAWPCPLLQARLGGLCPVPCSRAWGLVGLPTSFLNLEISLLCFELGDVYS